MSDRKVTIILATLFMTVAVAAILAVYVWREDGGGIAKIGGPFVLVDHTGAERTEADLKGRHALIYFGYTFCPDVCPTALADMLIALDELGPDAERVQPVFITIDPDRDTPAVLKGYIPNFHPRLIGLSGSAAQVSRAARAYRVYYAKVDDPNAGENYLMDHSSVIYLMDPDGRYLTHFSHGTGPETMAKRLRELVS
ncbi:MAG: SCO family protein [Defluviicoccus sp.]|nr:SCO family protein [Defluviicoccus sp.]